LGGDHNLLTEDLRIRDNFTMLADEGNEEGISYYVLQCQRPTFIVCEGFDCVWGNSFSIGDSIVEGIYYEC
jgi:hypothetical protein